MSRVASLLRAFFAATTHPVNLAVARVVVFGTLLVLVDVPQARLFAALPDELRVAPFGYGSIVRAIPAEPGLVTAAGWIVVACSALAVLGLFTRVSAIAAVVVGLYVLGIPQLYGKVTHYHHVLWFAAVLAASPCADVLSLDAVRKAWRVDGSFRTPAPSRAYALPLRFVWLLTGVVYLFSGLAKVARSGIDWVVTDNLRNQMYEKWADAGAWEPLFRIDRYPVLPKVMAALTILLEVSFIVLVLFPLGRAVAAIAGALFHAATQAFLRIGIFWTLLAAYLTFVDWHRLLGWIGRRLYPTDLRVLHEPKDARHRRIVGLASALDLFGRVEFVVADAGPAPPLRLAPIVVRVPLMAPFWPLLARRPRRPRQVAGARGRKAASPVLPIVVVGVGLLVLNATFGALGRTDAWPFAAYPRFSRLAGTTETTLRMVAVGPDGQAAVGRQSTDAVGGPARLKGLLSHVASAHDDVARERRLRTLVRELAETSPQLRHAGAVRLLRVTSSTLPERRDEPPQREEVVAEIAR